MAKARIKDKDLGLGRITRQVMSLGGLQVEVGFTDPDNATKAVIQEFGAPGANIPARPFMRTALDQGTDRYTQMMREGVGDIIDGRGTAEGTLRKIGEAAVGDVRESILSWSSPPNAPATIARKGFDGPLYETGEMADAVTYEISREKW